MTHFNEYFTELEALRAQVRVMAADHLTAEQQLLDRIERLTNDLTVARAELNDHTFWAVRAHEYRTEMDRIMARAERAEAELAEANADLDDKVAMYRRKHLERAERAEAAITRIRELCADPPVTYLFNGMVRRDRVRVYDVLRALDGDQ